MRFQASALAAATRGRLIGDDIEAGGVTIDSRAVVGGQLFVPIVAERDGHDFIESATRAGAALHLTTDPETARFGPAIVVSDTAAALIDIGRMARRRLPERVIGITGSVGKTTTKDLLHSVLATRYRTAASEKSFNNELGVPLTLANAPDDAEAVVVEMGARGLGHISQLSGIAQPTIGVVTVVAGAHLAQFGSIDEVARAKGELIESLPAAGTAILNADDARVAAMAERATAPVVTFGITGGDIRAEAITVGEGLRVTFELHSPGGVMAVDLAARGRHNVVNALAAAAAGLAAGCSLGEVAAGLGAAQVSPMRMNLVRTAAGAWLLDDSYNANPTSMHAALDALAAIAADRRVAVLGTMAELGPDGPTMHRQVAEYARERGIEVVAVAEPAYGVDCAADVEEAGDRLGLLGEGDAVLVKASRVAGLERLVTRLQA